MTSLVIYPAASIIGGLALGLLRCRARDQQAARDSKANGLRRQVQGVRVHAREVTGAAA